MLEGEAPPLKNRRGRKATKFASNCFREAQRKLARVELWAATARAYEHIHRRTAWLKNALVFLLHSTKSRKPSRSEYEESIIP